MQKYVKLDDVISLFCKIDCGADASPCSEECKDIKDFRDLPTIDLLNGSDIRFYIPPDITVPTGLMLMVDGVRVDYEHSHFTDVFDFYIDTTDKELAMAIAEKIVARIQKEHNDFKHGVTWRTIYLKIVTEDDYIERYGTIRVMWKYRVKDSY